MQIYIDVFVQIYIDVFVQIYIDAFVQTRVRATDLRTEAVATVNISVINVNDWDPQVHVHTVQNTEIVIEKFNKTVKSLSICS